jgi:phthalate 4,5-dioxygenase
MLTQAENELLARVTGDAPMGRMMRRYWVPACTGDDLRERGDRALRIRLFGEPLLAFRDAAGGIELLDERWPHRAHAVREAGGVVWAYLGPPEGAPAFPAYDWTRLPAERRIVLKAVLRANYLQGMEGSVDSAHSWFLHRGAVRDWTTRSTISGDLAPRLESEDTAYGFRYAAIRRVDGDETRRYIRVTLFALPFAIFIPRPLDPKLPGHVQLFAPIDDQLTMFYGVFFSRDGTSIDGDRAAQEVGLIPGVTLDANAFRDRAPNNHWRQDRTAMKTDSYVGIDGVLQQDMAVQESMGPIVDRTREHLGTSDVGVIRIRRRLLDGVQRFERGEALIGHDPAIPYDRLASEQRVIGTGEPWQAVGAHAGEFAAV